MNRLSAPVATSSLLVADAECGQIQDLVSGSKAPVLALVAQAQGTVLAQISEDLRQKREAGQPVRTMHLIAHGRPGAFRLGDAWIDAEALKAHATELAHWGVETIALWSCHVGADADFVALLAELSGAQVLASADWLGRDEEGYEQLQLGAWSLADVTDASAWPESFRLATTGETDWDDLPPGIQFTADNGAHIYLNGNQLDGGYTWDWKKGFDIPLDDIVLRAGKNVLAIAGWDSEEIAAINGLFKFSDNVQIGTSSDGWKVWNADWKQDPRVPEGSTGLYSYDYYFDDNGKVVKPKYPKDHPLAGFSVRHEKFPFNEQQLKDLYEEKNEKGPDIPAGWTEVDFEMVGWVDPGESIDNPWPWGQKSPDSTWLWYGDRMGGDEPDKSDSINPENEWTKNNLTLFRFGFETKFRIEGTGFCETEVDFGTSWPTANAEFEILFNEPLKSDERFSYALVGNGDGGAFELLDLDLIAYDAKNELVPGGVEKVERSDTYEGNIVVAAGVQRVEWAASWKKMDGDLTGQESVTLTFEQGGGESNGVITTDTKKVVLDENGNGEWEKNCTPDEVLPELNFGVEGSGFCATDFGNQVADAAFTIVFKNESGDEADLSADQELGYVLTGAGDEADFTLMQKSATAYDADGKVVVGGVTLTSKTEIEASEEKGSTYVGTFEAKKGVSKIVLAASWKKTEGDLTGEEKVKLSVSQDNGLDPVFVNAEATLDGDGDGNIEDNCPPDEKPINRSFKLEAECASLVANEVSASASAAALKADDCGCSPTMLMAAPEASLGLEGSAGSDDIDGGAADDEIDGGSGDDDLSGGAGDDEIDGGAGVDVISGGIGQDDLDGGAGNDVLNGGVGNDLIDGGDGDDLLSGGSGSDDFQISAGNDIIKDFNPLDFDKIVLPPAPLLPPGQMPSFTQEGADVFIRYQNWKTVVQNALVKDVVIAAKADQARFSFKVSELDLPELPGSLGSETFYYRFDSNKQGVVFGVEEAYLSNSAGGRIELERDSSVGDFEVPYRWEEFNINVLVSKPDGAFDGDEALTLVLRSGAQGRFSMATSDLADPNPACSPEPPPPPQLERPEILLVGGGASCEIDGEINGRDALFQYTITLKPGDSSSTFNYDFSATGLQADGYTLDVTYSTPSGQVIWMLAIRLEHSPWVRECPPSMLKCVPRLHRN